MAIITQEITVEVAKLNYFQALVAKQGDINSRFLKITFENDGEKIYIQPTSTVRLGGERPDGQSKVFIGEVNDDGTATVPLVGWLLELPGLLNCDATIVDAEGGKLSSTSFKVIVDKAACADEDIYSDENYDILTSLAKSLEGGEEIIAACEAATVAANEAAQKTGDHPYAKDNPHEVTAEQAGAEPAFATLPMVKGGTGATDRVNASKNINYLGMNPIQGTDNDTVENWVAQGSGFAYYNTPTLRDQPTQRGFLINKVCDSTVHQEWYTCEATSKVYVRAGQGASWWGGNDTNKWALAGAGLTAADVGARPDTWTPSASDVGAVPTSRKVNGKALSSDITLSASDVSARASTWMPTASDVGARPSTWTPTAADVGAIPQTGGNFSGTTVVVGFVHDGGNSPVNRFVAKAGEMVCYGDRILSMYTIQDGGGVYGVNIMNGQLQPNGTAAGSISLGRDGRRFTTVWLVNAANVGSDRNIKTDIHGIDERFVEFFDRLEPVSYKLIGNNHDRDHLGFIAQDVKSAMDEAGITDMEFGGYCRDVKLDEETEQPILDDDGNPVYTYSLRYGEFIALNTMMIQRCQAEIKELRAELDKLKNK